jgi:hypothetical protein
MMSREAPLIKLGEKASSNIMKKKENAHRWYLHGNITGPTIKF